jgi:hypothetical protein
MSRNVTQTRCKLAIDVPNSKTQPQNPIGKYISKLIAHSLIVDLPKGLLKDISQMVYRSQEKWFTEDSRF